VIARVWRGAVRPRDPRQPGGQTEFVFISLWESMEAIRRFAGDDVERAHYYPEDRDFLLHLEPTVTHHTVTAVLPQPDR